MVTSRSQLFAPTSSQIERAWHLLTILIRLGRPARPAELASRFALDSTSLSSDLVEFLCRIPGSPLFLTDDRLVTVSGVAVAAFGEFLVGAIPSFVPRVAIRVSEQRRDWGDLRLMYVRKRKVRPLGDGLVGPSAKRRLLLPSESDVEEELRKDDGLRIQSSPTKALKVYFSVADILAEDSLSVGMSSSVLSQEIALTPSLQNSSILLSSFGSKNNDHGRRDCESEKAYDDTQAIIVHKELPELSSNKHGSLDCELNAGISEAVTAGRLKMSEPDTGPALLDTTKDKPVLWMETLGEGSCILTATPLTVRYEVNSTTPTFQEAKNESNVPSIEIGTLIGHTAGLKENEVATEANYCQSEGAFKAGAFRRDPEKSSLIVQTSSKLESPAVSLSSEPATVLKHQRMSSEKPKVMDGIVSTVGLQSSVWESNKRRNGNLPKQEQAKRDEKGTFVKQKMKRSRNLNMPTKENRLEAIPKVSKSHSEPKLLPNFESFVIEEEEGSGGYGTVYRARRKEDGKIFALKYPHPNAHSHHVNNELKMLERFGGRNFVIKYEGSFRSGHSECFVLEHVEHDRPEVLKKEIDIFELQWYGYCMFRALASLHKQGIVHRDVKPGNFLFSRKLNKGYLIDFNLANDLHQKFSRNSRSGTASHVHLDPVSLPTMKSTSYTQARKVMNDGILDNVRKEVANDSRKLILKNMKKRSSKGLVDTFPNIDSSNKYGSQAADASGVTSAKDPTSTRTPSADRLKQPMPCKGRKELISFVHEAMQSPNHQVVTGPASQRKRVAAPLGKVNRRLIILTPMPLHSGGNAVAGAGMFSRGNGKHKREGPCVGTKGFRAPEVLFKSYHQGCKVDIWSAGVTLLYLMIGRTPFGGDPEQNIKEIAKLRGSEDLWEVAKLHNCESSYPPDLFDVQSLQSMELREWCVMNTKRPEFLELVPLSLFDLVDRCLTVNPRRRITAEEALMHNFFTPCHESLRKQRLLRRAAGSESGSQSL